MAATALYDHPAGAPPTTDDAASAAHTRRQQAQATALERAAQFPENVAILSVESTTRLLHELRVHQIELEMQNEELRRTQAELDASQTRYFDFYDLAPVGYCTVDEHGLILQANLMTATLLAVPRHALVKQRIDRFIFKQDQDNYYLLRKKVLATSPSRSCDLRMVRPDGSRIWLQLMAIAAHDEDGAAVLRMVMSDISERKRVEAALQTSEAFSLAILNSVSSEIAVLSSAGVILAVNEPWRRFAQENGIEPGRPTPGTDIGANYLEACQTGADLAPEGSMNASDGIQAVLNGRLSGFSLEYPCHSPRQQRWFSMSVTPLGEAARGCVVITHTNITERKQIEEDGRIAAIAFESQEGMAVMDAKLKILRVNQAFTDITGYSQPEAEGKTTAITRSKRYLASFFEDIWREIERTGSWRGDIWQRRKNGEEYPARVTTTAVTDETGQVTHYVGHITDVTHLHQQEQQRLRAEAAHRSTLVREVHHRIKNNLQGITGLLRQFAQQHPETAAPINQAIGQVQGISVIHGLQGRTDTSSVRLCELTAAIADEVQNLWQTPVAVDIPSNWLPCVIAEKEAVPIALVLNELILNAVKHGGKAHGHVSVTLRKGEQLDTILLTIYNSGQLRANTDRPTGHHHGLQLVGSLMPRDGARLTREQLGDRVATVLELTRPVIHLDMKEPT